MVGHSDEDQLAVAGQFTWGLDVNVKEPAGRVSFSETRVQAAWPG